MEFRDRGTADIFNGIDSKGARRTCPSYLRAAAIAKLDALDFADSPDDLRASGNRLHRLQGDRFGQYAVRLNDQYRVCFAWRDGEAIDVEIVDYH